MIALDASALRMHPGSVKVVVHAQAATSLTRAHPPQGAGRRLGAVTPLAWLCKLTFSLRLVRK